MVAKVSDVIRRMATERVHDAHIMATIVATGSQVDCTAGVMEITPSGSELVWLEEVIVRLVAREEACRAALADFT